MQGRFNELESKFRSEIENVEFCKLKEKLINAKVLLETENWNPNEDFISNKYAIY